MSQSITKTNHFFAKVIFARKIVFTIFLCYISRILRQFLHSQYFCTFPTNPYSSCFRSGYDSNNRILIYFFSDQAHNVTIHNKERSLRAGSQHEFTCEALGSRPAAVITWWFDEKEIEAEIDNVQIVSLISFAT